MVPGQLPRQGCPPLRQRSLRPINWCSFTWRGNVLRCSHHITTSQRFEYGEFVGFGDVMRSLNFEVRVSGWCIAPDKSFNFLAGHTIDRSGASGLKVRRDRNARVPTAQHLATPQPFLINPANRLRALQHPGNYCYVFRCLFRWLQSFVNSTNMRQVARHPGRLPCFLCSTAGASAFSWVPDQNGLCPTRRANDTI
jgi:hypothetical protein